ncbi:MAG: hypothetical protein SFU57_01530, partial [Gemmatimonadales bacterium]|nr:hypothetical protein [Gemmatimonadales bacterium]
MACTEESALPTDSTADPVLSGAPAADPQLLNALMINGGCRDASGSDGALTMVLAAPGGSARRYDCTAIGRDSMFTLARSYRSLARRVPGVIRAQTAPVGGSWEPYSYEREYCRISGNTGAVLYCGIF